MKYIFRGHTVFEYDKEKKTVIQHKVSGVIPAFDFCHMIPEDYMLLGEFFNTIYHHTQGKEVELKDIKVY